jgi:hypothetical protein
MNPYKPSAEDISMIKHKHLSEDHKRKISEGLRGRHHSDDAKKKMSDTRKGLVPWNKGKMGIFSEESRKKMSESKKGKGNPHSEDWNKKISDANKGKRHSPEIKIKISEARKGKGCGERNGRWNNGTTPLRKQIRHSTKYAQWRQNCFIRDNFTCQKCGKVGGDLEVHHRKPFSRLLEEARNYMPLLSVYEAALIYTPMWKLENGITLCGGCHNKTKKGKHKR